LHPSVFLKHPIFDCRLEETQIKQNKMNNKLTMSTNADANAGAGVLPGYACDKCDGAFSTKYRPTLNRHKSNIHSETCEKFGTRAGLKRPICIYWCELIGNDHSVNR
jgi:hypothetical protein